MQRNACILRVECFVWNKVLAGNKNVLVKGQLYWCSNHSKSNAGELLREDSQHLCLNNCFNMLLQDNPAYDKHFKVRPLLDRLANTFCKEYRPSKFVSIDEGMVKYKGRLGFKQYMPMKPVKRGIKVWVRADATNSFVSAMQVYTGKEDGGQPEHGLGHCVVCDLVSDLKGKNYHIFCNNFFTSARLVEDLLSDKFYLCGTTHANRTDFPKDLKLGSPK